MRGTPARNIVLFAYGFRPFFLLAGVYAALSIGAWLWLYGQGASSFQSLPPRYWHGHEMIFGFFGAAIAGFLLTAVPNWTGRPGFSGAPLMAVAGLWLVGRIAFLVAGELPFAVLAIAQLSFLPVLILMIAPLLMRAGNRNQPLLVVLGMLWLTDGCFLYATRSDDWLLGSSALLVALDLVLVLVTVIGGRIVPVFTRNALREVGTVETVQVNPALDRFVILAMLAVVVGDLAVPGGKAAAGLAAIAAGLQAWRLSRWCGWRSGSQPIVWILHLAYLWLPAGLVLKAAALGANAGWAAFWQHALGAGAAATMVLAVMTRAALGHTGRPLRVRRSITIAYLLLTLSVFVRVFGTPFLAPDYRTRIFVAGALWIAAFITYLVVYGPILARPRVDGKPG